MTLNVKKWWPEYLIIIVSAILLTYIGVQMYACDAEAVEAPAVVVEEDDGRLPGDDIPAREPIIIEYPEEDENLLIEQALMAKATLVGTCKVTHYDACTRCCGKSDGIGARGVKVIPGVSVAVDRKVIPLGSTVLMDYGDGEIHYMRADDTGGSIRGNRIDVCCTTHSEANQLGVKYATVWYVKE